MMETLQDRGPQTGKTTMRLTQLFLDELDRESSRTRPALEGVPAGRDDWTPPPGSGQFQQPSAGTLAAALDQHVAKARESLLSTTDEFLMTTSWRLKAGGQVVMNQPRHIVLRDTLNHLAHHRGQLTVYLRLLDQPVPAIYGP